jgi:TonB-dependent receptor
MRRSLFLLFLVAVLVCGALRLSPVNAQERKATIMGRATDTNHDPLVGAKVELQPLGQTTVTDAEGAFKISDLAPGSYTVNITYVGFASFSKQVTLAAGGTTNVDAELQIETVSEQVIVRGERERGEIEALNREKNADNIVQVLPAEVIISLPNTNIADAVGRLPSVSLERDEGEGKYVQIRGTEPRLSNVTIDGVHVPSPESVRNVKLDTIPADMVDSVEINKTLSANQEGDAIGGSVNLVTKKATDQPYLFLEGLGGITPIEGTRGLYQFDGTIGKRFGQEKRLGLLFSGSYDYNARGIDDIEPSQGINPLFPNGPDQASVGQAFPGFQGTDVRAYQYYRKRGGIGTSIDYKLGANSLVYLRGLYSEFRNYGEDWIYTPSGGSYISPTLTNADWSSTYAHVIRRPAGRIINVTAGANHSLGKTLVTYEVALGHGRAAGGFFSANFAGPAPVLDPNTGKILVPGPQFAINLSDPHAPKFTQVNATPSTNIYDPANYVMAGGFFKPLSLNTQDNIFERDLTGSISVTRQYSVGSHFGAFEVGAKVRDTHKSQLNIEHDFDFNGVLHLSDVVGTVPDFSYYFGNYKLVPFSSENKIVAFYNANRGLFPENFGFEHLRADSNDYTTSERVSAGYVMNTITLGHFRVQAGLRIEGTQGHFLGTVVNTTPRGVAFLSDSLVPGEKTYTNFLPSVQAQYNFNGSTNVRVAYGRGIARPNFSDIPPSFLVDQSFSSRPRVTEGNPNLKPTHADNFDILFEHYLKTVGIIEGGWFYKHMTDPIVQTQGLFPANDPQFPGFRLRQQTNFDTAYITGVEFAWQQHLKFLPGPLNGMGVSANYSYTKSGTSFPAGIDGGTGNPNRTDNPPLVRQSPNNWNFDATYDKGIVSARMGLSHNDANIQFYGFQSIPSAARGGPKGPNGDFYFYPHTQVDAQASFRLPGQHGLYAVVSMLNLTNEVFGFYQGSEQFPTQREYYGRTVSFGFRWTPPLGK